MQLGRNRRVRKREEFRQIQSAGCRVTTPHFVLVASPRESSTSDGSASPGGRLGITASRKVGNAVRRNRVKRLVREAFRHFPEVVPEGMDLVVICRQNAQALGRDEVISEWKSASGRLKRALLTRNTAGRRAKKSAVTRGLGR